MSEQSDQDLLLIIKELNDNLSPNSFQNPEVIKLRDNIKSQGLYTSLKLCLLAISNGINPYAKFLLFSILSSLIHPRTPPELLLEIYNKFVPLAKNETTRLSKLSIYKCIANTFYHLVSENNIDEIGNLLPSIGDDSIIFLNELMSVLQCSIDVPMLAAKNFVIMSKVIPELLPPIISCFFSDPELETYLSLKFCLDKLQQPPMEALLSKINERIAFNTEEFVQQIRLILNSKMPEIINAFGKEQLSTTALSYLVQFFTQSIIYGLDISITEAILRSIFNIPFNSENSYCFCQLIKTVYKNHKGFLSNDLVSFLCAIALENSRIFNLENLKIVLNVISYFLADLMTNSPQEGEVSIQPQLFPQLSEQILPLLIRQYPGHENDGEFVQVRIISMNNQTSNQQSDTINSENGNEEDDDDDDDQFNEDMQHRDDIMEYLAYFALSVNPIPSLEIIEGIFVKMAQSNQANFYICEWVLGLISKFLSLAKEREENETEIISPFALRIVTTPLIGQLAQEYSSIEGLICDIFSIIENKEIALTAFRLAISKYSSDDAIINKAIYLANEYKFVLLDEIPADSPLSGKMLTLLAYNSPSPAIEQRINELMESGDTNKMQEATALIVGLLQAEEVHDFEFNTIPYAITLSANKMFAEALKISYNNPETCDKIIEMAAGITFEEDVFNRIVLNALRAAIKNCNGILTEKVLIYTNIERELESKIIGLIIDLFVKHKEKIMDHDESANLTDNSLMILIVISKGLLSNSNCFFDHASKIIESLAFYFHRVFFLIDNEFWLFIFQYFLMHNLEGFFYPEYTDLLFIFSLKDFERYQSIFMTALSSATDNSEELFSYLHNGIDRDTPEMRTLYHNRYICVYKAFSYYKQFT